MTAFSKRTFLVTGVSSGIGQCVAETLLRRSANVVGISRKTPNIDPAVWDDAASGDFKSIICDLSDFDALTSAIKKEVKPLGRQSERPLMGAVLCHGYGDFGAVEQFSNERIESLVATNLTSHMMIARLVLPVMKTIAKGDVVFIGSESSLKGGKKGAVYCATKFGLRGFVQSLRPECASSNVRVSIVNPGMVDTPFFDKLDFAPGKDPENYLHAQTVANGVMTVLDMPDGTVLDELNVSPLKTVIRNK